MYILNEQLAQIKRETKELRSIYSFGVYASTLRKIPTQQLYEAYLLELDQMIHEKKHITSSETQSVLSRKLWSDIVSETHEMNQVYAATQNVKKSVIYRLKTLELGEVNLDKLFDACVNYMRDYSILTVTFKSNILNNGLSDSQLLNMYEANSHNSLYKMLRNGCEVDFANTWSEHTRAQFIDNLQARPRYGAIQFRDRDASPISPYGTSFIVLKDIVKFNTIFMPSDSLHNYNETTTHNRMCTFHNMELLLLQCPIDALKAVVKNVDNTLPLIIDSDAYLKDHYFEIMLPAINIFDPNLIEHIYIDRDAYQISEEDQALIRDLNINLTNISKPKHVEKNRVDFKETYIHQKSSDTTNASSDPYSAALKNNHINRPR